MNPRCVWLLLILLPSPLSAKESSDDLTPPLSGQPDEFTGGVGQFQLSVQAEPLTVQLGQAIRFTLRVKAIGKVHVPPGRPPLAKSEDFLQAFAIEDLPPDRRQLSADEWEFAWSLKPRSVRVKEIPSLGLAWYAPTRKFETKYTDELPIEVKPAEPVPVPRVERPRAPAVPDFLLRIEQGEEVLDRERAWSLPAGPVLAALLLVPPLLAVGWLMVWWRLHPEMSRKRLRSRAARLALRELQRAGNTAAVVAALTDYLRNRLGLPTHSPTPVEVATHLRDRGAPEELIERARTFFVRADAVRYAPGVAEESLAGEARALVEMLEGQPWPGFS